jgi:hypothetical protein
MTASNVIYFATIVGIVLQAANTTLFFHGLVLAGIGLIIGRTAVLIKDVSAHSKVV